MVSFALGTQTGGSVIRPSSFCGVVGFKPSYGRLPRTGVLQQSFTLDTVGVHARSVEDAALLAQTLCGADGKDWASTPQGAIDFVAVATSEPPAPLRIGFVKQAVWSRASEDTQRRILSFVESFGDACREVPLSNQFDTAHDSHRCIHVAEMAKCYRGYMRRGRKTLSEAMRAAMEEGATVSAVDYQLALDHRRQLMNELDQHWQDFDVIVTPAANGEAPLGLQSTGDPAFSAMWTMLGVPSITLPLLRGEHDMPVGVQLVGRYGEDAALLRAANWFSHRFSE
jgi:aspartyl-tRNA(Asn)/glutamyl-tRNA(Gln) amidotransferase subunit A